MATNRDLIAILFDWPGHLTVQNIIDHFKTTREHVEDFYEQMDEAGLIELQTTAGYKKKAEKKGWSRYIDEIKRVDTKEKMIDGAKTKGLDLDDELPLRSEEDDE